MSELETSAEAGATEHYDFDPEFQFKIVALLTRDTSFSLMTEGLVSPAYFDNSGCAAMVQIVNAHFRKYKSAPGDRASVVQMLKDAAAAKLVPVEYLAQAIPMVDPIFGADIGDRMFVGDKVAEFARQQATTKAIIESVPLLERREFAEIEKKVKAATSIGLASESPAYSYNDEAEARMKARQDRRSGKTRPMGITTGYAELDKHLLHRGWGRREMSLLMGPAKSGKSMSMLSFSVGAIFSGYKVLYVTLEVSKDIISDRLDAQIADVAMMELDYRADAVYETVVTRLKDAAKLEIHEAPSGTLTPSGLRRIIEQHKAKGLVFDLVVLDYADLMKPDFMTNDPIVNSKSVYVDLRGMAMDEGFALLTATQTNREGAKKAVAEATDVAEDFNRIRIADVVISINKTEEERLGHRARLHFAASRNQKTGHTVEIEQDIDKAKFITRVIGEV